MYMNGRLPFQMFDDLATSLATGVYSSIHVKQQNSYFLNAF